MAQGNRTETMIGNKNSVVSFSWSLFLLYRYQY